MPHTQYEFLYVGYRLVGRGYTGEIAELYVNGVSSQQFQRLDHLLNHYGEQGWELKAMGDKGEHGTFEKLIFQRPRTD